jgi:hypothetical protein
LERGPKCWRWHLGGMCVCVCLRKSRRKLLGFWNSSMFGCAGYVSCFFFFFASVLSRGVEVGRQVGACLMLLFDGRHVRLLRPIELFPKDVTRNCRQG